MDSLPNEVLESIFDYLPPFALESMLLVSIKHHDIITGSSKLMLKIQLKVSHFSVESNSHSHIKSSHVRSIWTQGDMPDWQIEKFINTQKMVMSCTSKMDIQRNLNLLADLSVLHVRLAKHITSPDIPLNKKILKEVIIKYDYASYFDENIQIKNLSIDFKFENFQVPDVTPNFLQSQYLLTSLKLTAIDFSRIKYRIFHEDFSGKIQFQLKNFELSFDCPVKLTNIKTNISKFLNTQQKLKTLKLDGPLNDELWEAILDLECLEQLELSEKCFVGYDLRGNFYKSQSITALVLNGEFSDEIFRKILISLPKVTKFVQKGSFRTTDDHLKSLAEVLPNLQNMQVRMFECEVEFKEHVFKNLKILKIDALKMYRGFPSYCNNFVKMFPEVERLSFMQGIPRYTIHPKVTDAIFQNMKNLKYFEIGPAFMHKYVVQYIR